MKKNYIILFLFIFFMLPSFTKALSGDITSNDVLIASEPNKTVEGCNYKVDGAYSSVYASPNGLRCLDTGDSITILNQNIIQSTISQCTKGYYYVSYTGSSGRTYNGYVCADYISTETNPNNSQDLAELGFPESYWRKLTLLKQAHPNWKFTAYKTGLKWTDVVNAESVVGISYIQVPDLSIGSKYISLDSGSYDPNTKSYIVREGINWYAANKETVSYYLDPRNFLTEKEIFMFENLGYNSNYQTLETVQNVLKNTDLYNYSNTYIEAATYQGNNVSPVFLAASSKQEVVLGDGKLSGSANGSGKVNDISIYNVYNIGAFSTCENPIMCGINFASGYNGTKTSYGRPWTSLELSIKNGAKYIADGYINQKQNTLYFKKFNVTSNIYGNYSNQYMTNIKGSVSEGVSTYTAYSKIDGLLNSSIEFIIPVYEDMPASTNLPDSVDQEQIDKINNQNEIVAKNKQFTEIINGAGYKYNDSYISSVKTNTTADKIISSLKENGAKDVTISSTTTTGTKTLTGDSKLGTGDIVSLNNGDSTSTFRIVIYGDVNGDGQISAVDYVKVKNYIMSEGSLNGSYKLAADVNGDNSISAVDYVNIKNYIMGTSSVIK